MNVTREENGGLTAILKVEVSKADYAPQVEKEIENYRKKSNIPGFRKGMVPKGLIQQQFGKGLLVEHLNKLTDRALSDYIKTNSIDIICNPIPKEDSPMKGDINSPGDFEFTFEIAYTPKISVDLGKQHVDYNKVKIDSELISKQKEDLRRRYGKLNSVDSVGDSDMVFGRFNELNADGKVKEDGVSNSSTISLDSISDEDSKKALIGKSVDSVVKLNPANVSRGGEDTKSMLGLTDENSEALQSDYEFTITEIKRMEMAELNGDFYDKVFGPGTIATEKEMDDRIVTDLAGMFEADSDRMFTRDVYDKLLASTPVALPEDFLKRWLKISSEKELTDAQIDSEFDQYLQSLKNQLIQGHIFKSNNVQLQYQEVVDYTKSLLIGNYAQYGMPAPEDEELTKTAKELLQKKETADGIYDRMAEVKLTQLFKTSVKINQKELSYDDFVAEANS